MNVTRPVRGRISVRVIFALLFLAAGVALLGAAVFLPSAPLDGSGYGLDKGADRSHELAGVKAASADLSVATGGLVVVDTSTKSLVFSEEHETATADVRVGHCTVGGTFRRVPFNTNGALHAEDVGPLYLKAPDGQVVTVHPVGAGQLGVIRASSLASCLTEAAAPSTAASR